MTSNKHADESNDHLVLTVPCPLCRYVFNCPFAGRPRDECLDLWPLGRPSARHLIAATPQQAAWREQALRVGWLREILEAWQSGERISDEQYLKLHRGVLAGLPDQVDARITYVLENLLFRRAWRHMHDAIKYYGISLSNRAKLSAAWNIGLAGAVAVADEDLIVLDADSPVQSHFERLFSDFFCWLLLGMFEVEHLTLPEDPEEFVKRFGQEWRRVLQYGNGYFGFTIIPTISILDMVRYQKMGGQDKIVSNSVANYLIWTMDTFPPGSQLVLPELREVAFKRRLMAMFEPLVEACVSEAKRRLKFWPNEERQVHRSQLREEFTAVLSHAIDEYDFMYGKRGTPEDAAGIVGVSASPYLRQWTDKALQALGLAVTSQDLAHVSVAHFLSTRLRQHLREHHPVTPRDSAASVSIDAPLGEAGSSLAESVQSTSGILKSSPPAGNSKVVACEVDGVKYLFIDEMALLCGVTSKQLRHWEDSGLVHAQRLGDIAPEHRGKVSAQWRVYPYTPQMIEKIRVTALRRATRCADLAEDEYNRSGAARVLGYSAKTLKRWEKQGIAQPIWRDNRPIYRVEEIQRLAKIKGRKV